MVLERKENLFITPTKVSTEKRNIFMGITFRNGKRKYFFGNINIKNRRKENHELYIIFNREQKRNIKICGT